MTTDLVMDAREQELHDRPPDESVGLIHHVDRGSQSVPVRYTGRLGETGIRSSVGRSGDAYDNALAESINGLYNRRFTGELHGNS